MSELAVKYCQDPECLACQEVAYASLAEDFMNKAARNLEAGNRADFYACLTLAGQFAESAHLAFLSRHTN